MECWWQEIAYYKFEDTLTQNTNVHIHIVQYTINIAPQPNILMEDKRSTKKKYEENSNAMGKEKSKNFLLLCYFDLFSPKVNWIRDFGTQSNFYSRTKHDQYNNSEKWSSWNHLRIALEFIYRFDFHICV